MALVARQVDGEIKLTWTYEPPGVPFWLDFVLTYDEPQMGFQTNTETIPHDCTLHMDTDVASSLYCGWEINGNNVVAVRNGKWEVRAVDLSKGDALGLYASHSAQTDFSSTMTLYLNDAASGEKVAEFDYTLKAMQCYLTTACVNHHGKADNGPELTAMRKLREHYIDKPGYKELIDQYYQLSAQIIKGIEAEKDPGLIYAAIYESVKACEKAVGSGHWAKAHDEYLSMYYRLVEKYCPDRKGAVVDDVIRRR